MALNRRARNCDLVCEKGLGIHVSIGVERYSTNDACERCRGQAGPGSRQNALLAAELSMAHAIDQDEASNVFLGQSCHRRIPCCSVMQPVFSRQF
jgi:hypothetical protein